MKTLLALLSLAFLVSCNPELQNIGGSENDLVKYFKITPTEDANTLGEGYLIIAHVGEKRLLTYYLRHSQGFSHTDVSLKKSEGTYVLDSVYSNTEKCKLKPDYVQTSFYEQLVIEGIPRKYKLETTTREEAFAERKILGC